MRNVRLLLLLIVPCLASCGGKRATDQGKTEVSQESAVPPAPPDPARESDEYLVRTVAFLATSEFPPDEIRERVVGEIAAARAKGRDLYPIYSRYIDDLLKHEAFTTFVVPEVASSLRGFTAGLQTVQPGWTLKQIAGPKGPVYHLHQPCDPTTAVEVRPWWQPDVRVLVCPDSHRPDVFADKKGILCNGTIHTPPVAGTPVCGCGPNLMRCWRDEAQWEEVTRSVADEVRLTIAYITEHDLPVKDLYTTEFSFRDRNVELMYRRWRVEAEHLSEIPDLDGLAQWPAAGTWAKRYLSQPGQHTGIITAHNTVFNDTGTRPMINGIYNETWCTRVSSARVATKGVLDLGKADTRAGDGWEILAAKPGCTECHASLDYGAQYFKGYLDSRAGHHFQPLAKVGVGPFYVKGLTDKRGEAALTPQNFGQFLTSQPEFRDCMVQKFLDHTLASSADNEDRDELRKSYDADPTFRGLMRAALERYVRRGIAPASVDGADTAKPSTAATTTPIEAPDAPGGERGPNLVRVSARLRGLLDAECIGCHHDRADFRGTFIDRPLLEDMVGKVAFRQMPVGKRLSPDDFDAFVSAGVADLWGDSPDAAELLRYYREQYRSLPMPALAAIIKVVHAAAGEGPTPTPHYKLAWPEESFVRNARVLTPGMSARLAIEALASCKQRKTTLTMEQCMDRAVDARAWVNDVPRAP